MENETELQASENLASEPEAETTEEVEETLEETPESSDLDEKNKQLYARAKKAEAEAKALRDELKKAQKPETEQVFTREEAILIAQGTSEEELEQLEIIRKGLGEGSTLKQAKESPLFKAYKKDLAEQRKRDDAQLGASNKSSVESGIKESYGSSDEHKKLWEKMRKK